MDLLDPRDPDPAVRRALGAWLAVQRAFAFRPQAVPACFRGPCDAAAEARRHDVSLLPDAEVARVRRVLAGCGVLLLPLASPRYPARLHRLTDAPPLLAVRGLPALLAARCVALVGARAATTYGRRMAAQLAGGLARAGLVVVSGLARGIDAAAHEAALAAGGATVAFQACGPERVYPPAHRGLAARIGASGAVVSELPVGTPPRGPYFPLRNRLISALAEAVVVVEARPRSGSLVTARHAADQGVDVLAVPGPADAATSSGPHQLLREGAGLAASVADVLEAMGLPARPAIPARESAARPDAGLAPDARRILARLRAGPASAESLGEELGLAPAALAAALARLELEGHAERDRDGSWALASPGGDQQL